MNRTVKIDFFGITPYKDVEYHGKCQYCSSEFTVIISEATDRNNHHYYKSSTIKLFEVNDGKAICLCPVCEHCRVSLEKE